MDKDVAVTDEERDTEDSNRAPCTQAHATQGRTVHPVQPIYIDCPPRDFAHAQARPEACDMAARHALLVPGHRARRGRGGARSSPLTSVHRLTRHCRTDQREKRSAFGLCYYPGSGSRALFREKRPTDKASIYQVADVRTAVFNHVTSVGRGGQVIS